MPVQVLLSLHTRRRQYRAGKPTLGTTPKLKARSRQLKHFKCYAGEMKHFKCYAGDLDPGEMQR